MIELKHCLEKEEKLRDMIYASKGDHKTGIGAGLGRAEQPSGLAVYWLLAIG